MIETAFSRSARAAQVDLPKLQGEWEARQPGEVRELGLPGGEVGRLLAATVGVLGDPTLAALAEVEAAARAIARRVAGRAMRIVSAAPSSGSAARYPAPPLTLHTEPVV